MKRFLILMFGIFLMTPSIYSQFLQRWTEDFDGSYYIFTSVPPSAWKTDANYYVSSHNSVRGVVPNMVGDSVVLTSSVYDLSAYQYVLLRFSHICKVSPQDIARIEYRTYSGGMSAWTALPVTSYLGKANTSHYAVSGFNANSYSEWSGDDSLVFPSQSWWKEEVFDISWEVSFYAGVQFRFILKHGNIPGTQVSYGWLIDNFELMGATYDINSPVVNFIEPFVRDTVYGTGPWKINAKVKSHTSTQIQSPLLKYTATYNDTLVVMDSILMTMVSGDSLWQGTIPQFIHGTKVIYSITGRDTMGNTASITSGYVIVKPSHPNGSISVSNYDLMLRDITRMEDEAVNNQPVLFGIEVVNTGDSVAIDSAIFRWSINGIIQPGVKWVPSFPLQYGQSVEVLIGYFVATGGTGNAEVSVWAEKINEGKDSLAFDDTVSKTVAIVPLACFASPLIADTINALSFDVYVKIMETTGALFVNPAPRMNIQTQTNNGTILYDTIDMEYNNKTGLWVAHIPPQYYGSTVLYAVIVSDTQANSITLTDGTYIQIITGGETNPTTNIAVTTLQGLAGVGQCIPDYVPATVTLVNRGTADYDFSVTPVRLYMQITQPQAFYLDTLISSGIMQSGREVAIEVTNMFPTATAGQYDIKIWIDSVSSIVDDDTLVLDYVVGKLSLPIDEDFSAGIPASFVSESINSHNKWATISQGTGTDIGVYPPFGTNMLAFGGSPGSMSVLYTLQIDLSQTFQPSLSFWYFHDTIPCEDYTDVWITIEGGITYTLLSLTKYDAAYGWQQYNIDLSAFSLSQCAILGFEAMEKSRSGDVVQYIANIVMTSQADLAVSEIIIPPLVDVCDLRNKDVKVVLMTLTNQAINFSTSPTSLALEIPGDSTYYLPLQGVLPGNSSDTFTVATNVDFSSKGVKNIKAYLTTQIDNYPFNDMLTTSISIYPALSVQVGQITSGNANCLPGESFVWQEVTLTNTGNMDLSNIELILQIDTGSLHQASYVTIKEVCTDTIPVGNNVVYAFKTFYIAPWNAVYYAGITAYLLCDSALVNDRDEVVECVDINDLRIISIDNPSGANDTVGSSVHVTVTLNNLSDYSVFNNVPLTVRVTNSQGVEVAIFTENKTVGVLATVSHTFSGTYTVPNDSVYFVQVYLSSIDNYPNNDTVTVKRQTFQVLHHITVVSNDTAMGSVTGNGDYGENTIATINATANAGYRFVQWNDGDTSNPRTITVTQDTAFTAVFAIQGMFHVSVFSNNTNMGNVTGSGDYNIDSTAVIEAIPDAGYRFMQWNDGITNNPRTITVLQDTIFTATFEAMIHYVVVNVNDPIMGTVTGNGNYTENALATIEAIPNVGYKFVQWNDTNTNNPRTITVLQDTTFTATFEAIVHYVAVNANDSTMGTVTGYGNYAENTLAAIEAIPNAGYGFLQWNDGNTDNPRTITVLQDTTFTAEFVVAQTLFYVFVTANDTNMGSVFGSGDYAKDSTITIGAIANSGYRFVQWDDGIKQNPRSITVTQDSIFTAEFAIATPGMFHVSLTANNAGMGSVAGSGDYAANSIASIGAIANQGYRFVEWNDGNTDNPRTITVTQDTSFMATLEPVLYNVSLTHNDTARGVITGNGNYVAYSAVTITATPNAGYRFVGWSDNNKESTRIITVTHDITLVAIFGIENMYYVYAAPQDTTMGNVIGSNDYHKRNNGENSPVFKREYAANSVASITAISNSGYRFVQWNDGNTDNPRELTVTGDSIFMAIFESNVGITDATVSTVSVYPNPATDNIHIVLPENVSRAIFTLYDMQSKLLIRQEINSQEEISISNFATGIYIYNVRTNKQSYQGKIVKP